MRLLLAMAAFAALTFSAFAQPPKEIKADERVDLQIGQARTFQFDKPYSSVYLSSEGVAKINIQTDRTLTILGTGAGETLVTVNFNDQDSHRMGVIVGGRMVKLYGTLNKEDPKDFVGFFCTEFGCGRADPDKDKNATSESVAVTTRDRRGNITTTTKNY